MKIDIERVTRQNKSIVNNLYPLFIHDNWAYSDTLPNKHGIIGSALRSDGQPAETLTEQSEMLSPYWNEQVGHKAFLIRVEGNPAGFCLLKHSHAAPKAIDHCIDEFFIVPPFRRHGVGLRVVTEVCGSRPGCWCVDMKARNQPAIEFWRRAIAAVSGEIAQEDMLIGEFGRFVRMTFSIGG